MFIQWFLRVFVDYLSTYIWKIICSAATYNFRSAFQLDEDPLGVELYFRPVIDDGAVIYLNGEEVLRLRMPAGEIDSGTFASASVSNADYEGPFLIAGNALRRGVNLVAVEVHQRTSGSSDVVFGLEASVLDLAPAKERVVSGESREKWVELFNRGSDAIDLSGWSFSSGIRYDFSAGETIGPGEYLVVAADREHLESIHPGTRIVGNFEGNLSGRSDRIVLRDALGNPADEVRYFDDGPCLLYTSDAADE